GGGSFESIFYKIMEGRADLDGVPDSILPLIRAAMARNPAERPTAQALVGLASRIDVNQVGQTRVDPPSAPRTRPLTAVAVPPVQPPQAPRTPRDFRGQLPPAMPPQPQPYAPPPYVPPSTQERRPDAPPKPDGPKPYGLYKVLSLLLLVAALGLNMVLP